MRLADSLSNPSAPLLRLIKTLERRGEGTSVQATPITADPVVVVEIKENRKLSPDELVELAKAYEQGATVNALSRRFGVHRQTVNSHLARAGAAKRSQVKMTPSRIAKAKKLYEQGWSTRRIGREFSVNASSVGRALRHAGVKLRPRGH
ncbi:hypothetical protein ACIRBZ_13980 [Streptomyces sp. NPDC094038]|uniref:hypothetical protein n=1 Tax=Streptomyces sp. NPDC094038 TaxID=3366055 RepID=UPI003803DB80